MRAELQRALFARYSRLFEKFVDTAFNRQIAYSIDCGDGWFRLIDLLSSILEEFSPDIRAERVTSLNGSLVYLISGGPNLGELGAVVAAQFFSSRVCETKGIPIHDLTWNSSGGSMKPACKERLGEAHELKDRLPEIDKKCSAEMGHLTDIQEGPGSASGSIAGFLGHKYGLPTACVVDVPSSLFNLTDCALAAIERILNPGRLNMPRPGRLPISRVAFSTGSGLSITLNQGASISAAERELTYKSRVHLPDNTDLSSVLLESRITAEIAMLNMFIARISLYGDLMT